MLKQQKFGPTPAGFRAPGYHVRCALPGETNQPPTGANGTMNHVSSPTYRIARMCFLLLRTPARAISAAAIAPAMILTGCTGIFNPSASNSSASPAKATVTISPQNSAVPISDSITLTATVINSNSPPTWQIISNPKTGGAGTLSSTSGYTVTYTAPPTPPTYGPLGITDYGLQSEIAVTATPSTNFGGEYAVTEISITAPSISTAIAPTTADVRLGSTVQFYGYAVGDINRSITFQVNGVTGGTAQTGTITNLGHYLADGSYQYWGLYTAPATMPMTGNTVTITVVSQADPSKSSSAIVTLN